MKSDFVTAAVYSWLRFDKNHKLVATEVGGRTIADILSYHLGVFTEIEVKVSMSDFKRDFDKSYRFGRKKIGKHDLYQDRADMSRLFKPNFFFFAVPEDIAEKALAELDKRDVKFYGLLVVNDAGQVRSLKRASNMRVKTDTRSFKDVENGILLRMGSQLATLLRLGSGLPRMYLKK